MIGILIHLRQRFVLGSRKMHIQRHAMIMMTSYVERTFAHEKSRAVGRKSATKGCRSSVETAFTT
ncbi:hypothetical protein CSC75_01005 [Pseudoxanthomonas wuyuanensis]|nr:hypothetical protein CSC75_01005 [Pseudoxanthomonas wuyuanensis]